MVPKTARMQLRLPEQEGFSRGVEQPQVELDGVRALAGMVRDEMRAEAVAAEAIFVADVAATLFEAGGQSVLTPAARGALREAALRGSRRALPNSSRGLLIATADRAVAGSQLATEGMTEVARALPRAAAKEAAVVVVKGIGRAACAGLLIDGAIGGAEAAYRYSRGNLNAKQACAHVLKEAATGAVANAAGVAAAAAIVALTGGMAAPLVVTVACGGAMATKLGLRSVFG